MVVVVLKTCSSNTKSLLVEFGVNKNLESLNFMNYAISIEIINNIE